MKHFIWMLCGIFVSGLLLGTLSACGAAPAPGETEVPAEASAKDTDRRLAYGKALWDMYLRGVLPDGTELERATDLGPAEGNQFAVEDVNALIDMGHGVEMTRKGVSGAAHNQRLSFFMSINNPALTAQNLVNAARASMKQAPGAYTMIEIPVIDLLPGDRETLIRQLVDTVKVLSKDRILVCLRCGIQIEQDMV